MVSRAPIDKITAYKKRMGWENIPWYSSFGSDFNVRLTFSVSSFSSQIYKAYEFWLI
jgi:predicted dithiol-disulfide oxidoreductase (DUF899 family)